MEGLWNTCNGEAEAGNQLETGSESSGGTHQGKTKCDTMPDDTITEPITLYVTKKIS